MTGRMHPESGFTLIEVLVAIAVLGIILLPLTTAMAIGYRTLDQTSNRLTSSSDAEFLASYLPSDIKSSDTGATTGITCSGQSAVTSANAKLQLNLPAAPLAGVATAVIVYWVKSVTGGFQLMRSVCGTTEAVVVARNIASIASVTVALVDVTRGYTMTVVEKNAASEYDVDAVSVHGHGPIPDQGTRMRARLRLRSDDGASLLLRSR